MGVMQSASPVLGLFSTKGLPAGEVSVAAALYGATLFGTAGAAPLRPLAILFVATFVAQLLRARDPNARDASSGIAAGTCLIPLLYLGQDRQGTPSMHEGFFITWLTALLICSYHALHSRSALMWAAIPAATASLLAVLKARHVGLIALRYAWPGVVAYALLLRAMPKSFTEGEAAVLSQLWGLLVYGVVGEHLGAMHLTKLRIVMMFGVFGALLLAGLIQALHGVAPGRVAAPVYAAVAAGGFGCVILHISAALGENSLVWLWGYLTVRRGIPLVIVAYFVAVIAVGLRFAPKRFEKKATTIARKYFHLLALLMFIPATLLHVRFLALALAVAFAVFAVIESLRIAEVEPLASAVSSVMKTYVDEKDRGAAVITHVYLLLGCAIPVWYVFVSYHGGIFSARSLLSATAGMTVTGLGDACASVVGVTFGRTRWSSLGIGVSKKTLEGSAAMLFSVLLFQYTALCVYGFDELSAASWGRLVLSDLLVVFLEATTDQVDNLLLPLCHLVTLQMV